jgi:hypothetical protein
VNFDIILFLIVLTANLGEKELAAMTEEEVAWVAQDMFVHGTRPGKVNNESNSYSRESVRVIPLTFVSSCYNCMHSHLFFPFIFRPHVPGLLCWKAAFLVQQFRHSNQSARR